MESVIEKAGEEVATEVFPEALAELTGRSSRKWAVILIAFVLGSIAAVVAIKLWQRQAAETVGGPDVDAATAPDAMVSA